MISGTAVDDPEGVALAIRTQVPEAPVEELWIIALQRRLLREEGARVLIGPGASHLTGHPGRMVLEALVNTGLAEDLDKTEAAFVRWVPCTLVLEFNESTWSTDCTVADTTDYFHRCRQNEDWAEESEN